MTIRGKPKDTYFRDYRRMSRLNESVEKLAHDAEVGLVREMRHLQRTVERLTANMDDLFRGVSVE